VGASFDVAPDSGACIKSYEPVRGSDLEMVVGMDKLRALVSEARRLRAQENWGEEAIDANTRILSLDPVNLVALNRRASCYRERMDLVAAEKDYRRALELSPENRAIEKALLEIEDQADKQRDFEKRVDEIRSIRTSRRRTR
jgi:tetratricopeptide (TPR) repeat protein